MEEQYHQFRELGIQLVAANVDGDEETARVQREHQLSFPVASRVPLSVAETLDAWTGVRKGVTYIQPCEFVIRPDGTVAASLYATIQLGRMDPEEVLRFVKARM